MSQVLLYRAVVSETLVTAFKRRVMLHLRSYGLEAARYIEWNQNAWPELRDSTEALAIVEEVMWATYATESPAVQIIWHLPDADAQTPMYTHVDQADAGMQFTRIIGVALSDWRAANGAPWYLSDGERCSVEINTGDIYSMTPDTPHSAGLNLSSEARFGMYLRWQKPM
jgi:ectoine hydroxylase-related dioxygenase (phytanoyl-CoA dioxygenase family)